MSNADPRIVLVADDDADVRAMLKEAVERLGHEVLLAADGREAIVRVTDIQPDLVLLDGMMPHVDGYTVCRHIKENDLLKRIKVIVYTGADRSRGKKSAALSGADLFIEKPLDPATLGKEMGRLFAEQDRESARLTNV